MNAKLIKIGEYLSYAIIGLGIIHEAATFTPLIRGGLECLSQENYKTVIYMSLVCGASLILSGWLLVLLLKKTEQYNILRHPILILSLFVLLNGILSVIFMFDNPFAWLVLVLGVSISAVSFKIRNT